MEEKIRLAVFGQKRLSREGGIEIVVKELCTRMAQNGCDITCYNRAGHHVSGAEYDKTIEYAGIRQKVVPTIEKKGLAAVSSSFFAALCSAFGRYDVVHIHAEGPAFFCWIPNKLDVSEIHINVAEDDEFAFTDLAGMYDASLMIPKKGAKSSIEIYYENEEKLAKYVMNVIENVNFEFYPELLDTLTEFYRIYIKSDEKEIVLWPLTVDDLDNRKLIITAMTNMIKSKDNDWVAQNANLMFATFLWSSYRTVTMCNGICKYSIQNVQ